MAAREPDSRRTRGPSRSGAPDEPRPDGPAEDREARLGGEDPDVVLDVPTLNVDELDLEVEDLRAHVSVRAEVANLVNINIGVDAYLDKVKLGIKGVEAQVLLKVKLERILGTIDRALSAIEQNPGLLDDRMREEGGDVAEIEGSVAEPGAQESEEPATQVEATDAARRKADELGVDLSGIRGSGPGGRIVVRDVREAAE